MAGIVAGSIAGGWSPVERREGDADSLRFSRNRSKSDLSKEYRLEPHPDTSPKDGVVVKDAPVDSQHAPSQQNDTTPAFSHGPYSREPGSAKKDDTAP